MPPRGRPTLVVLSLVISSSVVSASVRPRAEILLFAACSPDGPRSRPAARLHPAQRLDKAGDRSCLRRRPKVNDFHRPAHVGHRSPPDGARALVGAALALCAQGRHRPGAARAPAHPQIKPIAAPARLRSALTARLHRGSTRGSHTTGSSRSTGRGRSHTTPPRRCTSSATSSTPSSRRTPAREQKSRSSRTRFVRPHHPAPARLPHTPLAAGSHDTLSCVI